MPFLYGCCKKCCEPNTDFVWCQQCDTQALIDTFSTWTSGNSQVDEAIRKTQEKSKSYLGYLEFIPYDRFSKIEKLGEGGFGTVYKAYWSDGERCYYHKVSGDRYYLRTLKARVKVDPIDDELLCEKTRTTPIHIVLKFLHNSNNISKEFLDEVITFYGCFNSLYNQFTLNCYGITCHPKTGYYGMMFPYVPDGNLRQCLQKTHMNLSWYDKVEIMHELKRNLILIHDNGFVHGDIHSGNILLKMPYKTTIIDFGLARRADRPASDEKGTYGIISYMAPEVLQGQQKTQASDIYALGMVLYEICSGKIPFHDRNYDAILQYHIHRGLRPAPEDGTPKCMIDLMEQCWNADPSNRPNAQKINETIGLWFAAISIEKSDLDHEDTGTLKLIREDIDQADQKRLISNSNLVTSNSQANSQSKVHIHSKYIPYAQINDILSNSENDSNIDSSNSFWNFKSSSNSENDSNIDSSNSFWNFK